MSWCLYDLQPVYLGTIIGSYVDVFAEYFLFIDTMQYWLNREKQLLEIQQCNQSWNSSDLKVRSRLDMEDM